MATTSIIVNVAESQNYFATNKTISVDSQVKEPGYINLSTNSVTINGTPGTTATVTVTSSSSQSITVRSSKPTKVSASISGSTITITGLESCSAKIYVQAEETSTHTSAKVNISVTATIVEERVPDFETATDQQIVTCVNRYYNGEITLAEIQEKWSVGMVRAFQNTYASGTYFEKYGSQDARKFKLVGINLDTLATPINGKTKALLSITSTGSTTIMSSTTYTNGYQHYINSGLRGELNTLCKNSFTNIKDCIKEVTKTTSIDWGQARARTVTHNDYVWVISYPELVLTSSQGDGEIAYPAKPTYTDGIAYTRSSCDILLPSYPDIRYINRSYDGTMNKTTWSSTKRDSIFGFCL